MAGTDEERAEALPWPPLGLANLLSRDRTGDREARQELVEAAMVFIWDAYDSFSFYQRDGIHNPLPPLFLKLTKCFDRVRDRGLTDPAEIEALIVKALFGKKLYRDDVAKDYVSIKANKTTNRDRRAKGLAPRSGLVRGAMVEQSEEPETDFSDEWLRVVKPDEEMIIRRHVLGEACQDIADAEGVTVYRVKQVIKQIRERVNNVPR